MCNLYSKLKTSTYGAVGCADLGLLDLLQLQDKLPGLLLYHVSLGGLNGDQLLQRGSIDTLLSLATGQPYPLNFSVDPTNAQRVRFCPPFASSAALTKTWHLQPNRNS